MPKIPEETITRILEAADAADVIGDFITLKRDGSHGYQACCPFHEERTPSFKVNTRKNYAKCFGCGWSGGALKFLKEYNGAKLTFPEAIAYLGQKYNIPVETEKPRHANVYKRIRPAAPRELKAQTTPYALPISYPNQSVGDYERNTLVCWMRSLPWNEEQRAYLEVWLQLYRIGTDAHGDAIFWQIDDTILTNPNGCVRSGKICKYNPDGHRYKDPAKKWSGFSWIHSRLEKRGHPGFDADKYDHISCLFGLHLLHAYDAPTVCIVESEKTAVLAATYFSDRWSKMIWMATASKNGLTLDMIKPIIAAKKRIVLVPDVDGCEEWRQFARSIDYDNIFTIDASNFVKHGQKADLADNIVALLQLPPTPPQGGVGNCLEIPEEPPRAEFVSQQAHRLLGLAEENKALTRLIETFNLTIIK